VKVGSDEVITVHFDHAGEKRLNIKYANLSLITIEEEARLLAENEQGIAETFEVPDAHDSHGHSSHWEPFFDDMNVLMEILPDALKRSSAVPCWADNACSGATSFTLPSDEPKGMNASPSPRLGLMMVIHQNKTQGADELVSVYPWISEGVEHLLRLKKVYPWHNRLEAQIEADLGDMSITFFDSLYARNKYFYRSDKEYSFILLGIAYTCAVVEPHPIIISDPEKIRRMRQNMGQDPEDLSPIEIETKGMAVLLPIQEGDRDDYEFQGPVKEVRAIDLLGVRTWRIRVTVARRLEGADSDIDIDIYVTEKALVGKKVPKAGDDIAGALWLQGYLWTPVPLPFLG